MTPAPAAACAEIRSLYVHVPFCERKCRYCDFVSVAGVEGQHDYVRALCAELAMLGTAFPGVELDTVFVGGGTPGLLEPELLAAIMDSVSGAFALAPGVEATVEANPSSTSVARAEAWLASGFTRVSLGVQSLEGDVLAFLGRIHDAGRALAAVADVRAAGFHAVNCDLIYAVPGLDDARWRSTLERILACDPGHVSCYELTVEPGTALHAAVTQGRSPDVDPECALRQHRLAVELLESAGYHQYEVSNFARPGAECRHNLTYWRGGHYLAAGVASHGHLPGTAAPALGIDAPSDGSLRYWHVRSVRGYVRHALAGRTAVAGHEVIAPADRRAEGLMLGLRLAEGVPRPSGAVVAELVGAGLLVASDGRVRTTPRGQEVLNEVALRLVDAGGAAGAW